MGRKGMIQQDGRNQFSISSNLDNCKWIKFTYQNFKIFQTVFKNNSVQLLSSLWKIQHNGTLFENGRKKLGKNVHIMVTKATIFLEVTVANKCSIYMEKILKHYWRNKRRPKQMENFIGRNSKVLKSISFPQIHV